MHFMTGFSKLSPTNLGGQNPTSIYKNFDEVTKSTRILASDKFKVQRKKTPKNIFQPIFKIYCLGIFH